ncbi:MAG: two-component system, OmpR family, response regulator [Acidimicrobiaceae bacterium]|jgi:DNA-binding NtrC family response regulator|nr:two-component system, OmpR family, response regulator [Acidimicrobiaceae bacterium]
MSDVDLTGAEPLDASKPVVLVVDDDPSVGRMVRLSLEIDGAVVLSAESLAEGRGLLRPGLRGIILDRRLPDGDGLELLTDIGAVCPDVPVVVYSGLDDGKEPPSVKRVNKTDIAGVFEALGFS